MQLKNALGGLAALTLLAGTAQAQTVTTADAAGIKKALAAKKGKVLLVNFWATWCGPCVAEFPDLMKVYKANRAKGLELVTISCDEQADLKKVKTFLGKSGVSQGWLNSLGPDITGLMAFLDPKAPDGGGSIPRTYVIDRNGKVVKSLLGGQNTESLQKAVAPYLKGKG
ncbi:MAG: TlpA disulfide reductase family protein [Capsulimonadales bacterium]|nr:TlpA disulfide reductase family protein [Capsulimonadales bacterium]